MYVLLQSIIAVDCHIEDTTNVQSLIKVKQIIKLHITIYVILL